MLQAQILFVRVKLSVDSHDPFLDIDDGLHHATELAFGHLAQPDEGDCLGDDLQRASSVALSHAGEWRKGSARPEIPIAASLEPRQEISSAAMRALRQRGVKPIKVAWRRG